MDVDQSFEPICERCRHLRALLLEEEEEEEDVVAAPLEFHFTKEQLGDARGPPVVCSFCSKDGHYKDACPDEVLPGNYKSTDLPLFQYATLLFT